MPIAVENSFVPNT